MEATIDQVGRVVVPKAQRDQLGLVAGSTVDISLYGDGLHLAPSGRTARLERRDGRLVAVSDTAVSDQDVLDLVDSIRR
ncbi:MAG: AbrB/MazE/SpoVT family DNA-binding domain-containing protein [Ilumatobacteraceae bacterium]|nr:AbrB/MazE/SpoVT family DNA-binding domain-containing protein [Ilumatobacteraceae bacterium]